MAEVCHRHGRSLPQAWQKFATGVAKVCHGQDTIVPKAGQVSALCGSLIIVGVKTGISTKSWYKGKQG
jgi:hypothetical protein